MKKSKIQFFSASVLFLLLGILLLFFPNLSIDIAGYTLAGVVIVIGVIRIIETAKLHLPSEYKAAEYGKGILLCVFGTVAVPLLHAFITVVPFVFGVVVIISGIHKIMDAQDQKRKGLPGANALFALAAISLILGLIIVFNPFESVTTVLRVIGIILIIDNAGNVWNDFRKYYRFQKDGYIVLDSEDDNIIDIIRKDDK